MSFSILTEHWELTHWLIAFGFCIILLFNLWVVNHEDLKSRHQRFVATMISKKIFAWFVATLFLYHDKIDGWMWVALTAAVFAIDVKQKELGLKGKVAS